MTQLPPPAPLSPAPHQHDFTGTVVSAIAGLVAGIIALVILAVTLANDASTYLIGAAFGLLILGVIKWQNWHHRTHRTR
jgi:hypothetical protein